MVCRKCHQPVPTRMGGCAEIGSPTYHEAIRAMLPTCQLAAGVDPDGCIYDLVNQIDEAIADREEADQ